MNDFDENILLPPHFIRLYSVGKGRYGDVFAVLDKRTGKRFACKTVIGDGTFHDVLATKISSSNHIIEIIEISKTGKNVLHIISELYEGGELYEFILENGPFDESNTKRFVYQICVAVSECHKAKVAHLDVKPENILLRKVVKDSKSAELVLIDFGHAKEETSQNLKLNGPTGSVMYAAPEVLIDREFSLKKSDAWSIGVVTFVLLEGKHPWDCDGTSSVVFEDAVESALEYTDWSKEAKDFVSRLLVVDKESRMSVENALKHEWLCN
jgi:serine/threonine protein kinase